MKYVSSSPGRSFVVFLTPPASLGYICKMSESLFLPEIFHGLVSHQDDKSDWVPE